MLNILVKIKLKLFVNFEQRNGFDIIVNSYVTLT